VDWQAKRRPDTLRENGASLTSETYTQTEGLAQNSVYAVHQNRDGSVWAGTLSAGVSNFRNGKFTTYTTQNGLASNTIASSPRVRMGRCGLERERPEMPFSNGHMEGVIRVAKGYLRERKTACCWTSAGLLWIGTANGLAFIDSGIVRTPPDEPASLHEQILGIEEDKTGSLWIVTSNHVLRVRREKTSESHAEWGGCEGIRNCRRTAKRGECERGTGRWWRYAQGRIWISTTRGISFISPTQTMGSSAPALVHIEQISADGRRFNMAEQVAVPAPPQRTTLTYSGLSLTVPARCQVQVQARRVRFGLERSTLARRSELYQPGIGAVSIPGHRQQQRWTME